MECCLVLRIGRIRALRQVLDADGLVGESIIASREYLAERKAMKICPSCNRFYQSSLVVCPRDGGLLNALREWRAGDSVSEKFRIVEKIGHGSLGPSFKAKLQPFGGIRVLKCLSVRLADDEDLISRFQTEIKAANLLKHINVAHVESLERSPDGRPFIVVEHVPGLSLRELLSRGGYIPALDVVDIMGQVCAALDYAHWQGIIHRNLKPDNIIIAEEHDGAPRVKVMEFGMANLRHAAAESGKQVGDVVMTDHGAVVGTMEYMSPEQAAGAPADKLDGRSDYYSVGVMMFEALTGELPLAAEDPLGLLHQYQGPAANELLCSTVLKALQKDPYRRFQTGTAMIAALREVSHSLGKPSTVELKPDAEEEGIRVLSSSPISQETVKDGTNRMPRATARQDLIPTAPQTAGRTIPIQVRPARSTAAATTDQSIDEIRKAWQETAAQASTPRPGQNRLVRNSLLFVCCALGVMLASSEIYRNRELLMRLGENTGGAGTVVSPREPDRNAKTDPIPLVEQSPLVAPSPVDQLPTVEELDPYPALPGASNDANASLAHRATTGPTPGQRAPNAAESRSADQIPKTLTEPTSRLSSDTREVEIKKKIAAGWLLVERGDNRAAVERFSEALNLDPSNLEAQAALRLARFAIQNPTVDVLPSKSSVNGKDNTKVEP